MKALNPQGMSRSEEQLMSCMIADHGRVFVSVDLSAGEPTVVSHYSGDKLFTAANSGMIGKRPYYDGDLLMISDQYIMTLSVSKQGRALVKQWWDEGLADDWVRDDEAVKKRHKKHRTPAKTNSLACLYEMGAAEMSRNAARNQFDLSIAEAKVFKDLFWKELFPGVKRERDRTIAKYERDGFIVNEFGFRGAPEQAYKAFNWRIQSSVSGIIKLLVVKFFHAAPWAKYIKVVHDELIFDTPVERLEETKLAWDVAVASLNEDLGWSVKIRTGWAPGFNMYTAK